MGVCDTCDTSYYNFIDFYYYYLIYNFMYHKKSLCFYVSQVSLKSFLGSERQGGSTGYAVVEGALAQYLVVSDFLVHLTEGDSVSRLRGVTKLNIFTICS